MRIVHEGRGGYIELDGRRYPIECQEGGRFCIFFRGRRSAKHAEHLKSLQRLVREQPDRWSIETASSSR